jgi:3-oxoacid CoA-transferase
VPQCDLPLTAAQAVDMVITELAVFEFIDRVLTLIELMPGSSLEEARARTSANFQIALRERPGG